MSRLSKERLTKAERQARNEAKGYIVPFSMTLDMRGMPDSGVQITIRGGALRPDDAKAIMAILNRSHSEYAAAPAAKA